MKSGKMPASSRKRWVDFNIDAKILNASQGPSITRYELETGKGVMLAKSST